MPLRPFEIKPGIVKDITAYAAGKNGPFWTDGDKVRFRNGFATKIGGWQKQAIYALDSSEEVDFTAEAALQGVPREILFWRTLDGVDTMAVGTHNHLYIIQNDGIFDITPLITSDSLTNPFTTISGSSVVTVADTSHVLSDGDFVVFSGSGALDGIAADTFNRFSGFQITYVDANSYTIETGTAATGSTSGGGGSVTADYLIGLDEGLGTQTPSPSFGWGSGTWGSSTWGTPRVSSSIVLENSQWSLSLWGEDLIATVRGGQIYYWEASGGATARASLVSAESGASDVPTLNRLSQISFPDRHLVSAGTNALGSVTIDPMLVRWSDQENFVDWTPTVTNTAGDQRLEIGTKLVAMMPTRQETFISTDEAVYGMTFIGPPFTFSFRLIGANCGCVGINTMMNVDENIYWMGKANFFVYDGSVKEIPCPVEFYVFDRLQKDYFDKCFAAHNKEFNEVSWFYPSTEATGPNPEPDSYVTYNYEEGSWSIGSLERTAWFDSFGFRKVPFSFSKVGLLYDQETGTDDDGSAMTAYVESSPMEVSAGDSLMLVDKIIPDATVSGNLLCTLYSKKYPNGSTTTKGPFTITSDTTKVSMRSRSRQMSLRMESTEIGASWLLGEFRVNAREDGLR